MGNAFITKGSTLKIGLSQFDIKANIIEDTDIAVGEADTTTITASDGSTYGFVGGQGDNLFEPEMILTDDAVSDIMTAVYGSATVGTNTEEWDLTNAGGTINDVVITTPATSGGIYMIYTAVNAKGVVVVPRFQMTTGGWQAGMKMLCDKWTFTKVTNA